jgi:outer membrane protein assembly factor BamC
MIRWIPFTCFRFDMTTPLQPVPARPQTLSRLIAGALLIAGAAGCSSISSMMEPDKIDYKSAGQAAPKSKLDVPPDLTQLKTDNRYAVPDNGRGTATASSFSAQRAATAPNSSAYTETAAVAPKQVADIRVERAGNQRWLVVKQPAEVLWPRIKDFWQENGFLLATDLPEAGVMETDWAEDRAKIPQDFIRNSIGKVFDSLYSTGERDKFRTRIERNADGTTEIFISHRGAIEVLTGQMKDRSMWTSRPSDPELEAEFLGRLMVRLGSDEKLAKATVAAAKPVAQLARLSKDSAGAFVAVDEPFDRAWRRVGLALDRGGFTVEDRDRTRGLYFVRYVDQGSDAQAKASEPGFFSRLFGSKDDKKSALRYRVMVKAVGEASRITVLDEQGVQTANANADRILSLLNDQLK